MVFIILQVSILQPLWNLSFSWFAFLTKKRENTIYHFVGLFFFSPAALIIFLGHHFPGSFSKKKSPAALIIFLGYHFPGSFSSKFRLRRLSFSWVIIFEVHFPIIFFFELIIFLGYHFPG